MTPTVHHMHTPLVKYRAQTSGVLLHVLNWAKNSISKGGLCQVHTVSHWLFKVLTIGQVLLKHGKHQQTNTCVCTYMHMYTHMHIKVCYKYTYTNLCMLKYMYVNQQTYDYTTHKTTITLPMMHLLYE